MMRRVEALFCAAVVATQYAQSEPRGDTLPSYGGTRIPTENRGGEADVAP